MSLRIASHLFMLGTIILLGFSPSFAQQIVITDDDQYSSNSAHTLLELYAQDHDKGILLPRLTSAQRQQIQPDASENALLLYDTDTRSFWYWDGTDWMEISVKLLNEPIPTTLSDSDRDSHISVESSPDEDVLRLVLAGEERMQIDAEGNLMLDGQLIINQSIGISQIRQDTTLTETDNSLVTEGTIKRYVDREVSTVAENLERVEQSLNFSLLSDEDADTRIEVEETPDEDLIRMEVAGQERLRIDSSGQTLNGSWKLNGGPTIQGVRQDTVLQDSDEHLATEGTIKHYVDQEIDSLATDIQQIVASQDQSLIEDNDTDTRIEVEANPDEDLIRFEVAGQEKMRIDSSGQQITGAFQLNNGPEIQTINADTIQGEDDNSLVTEGAVKRYVDQETAATVTEVLDSLDSRIDNSLIRDEDADTRIAVEENPDEDLIRVEVAGQERLRIDSSGQTVSGNWKLNNGPTIAAVRQDTILQDSDSTLVTEGTVKRYVDQKIANQPQQVSGSSLYLIVTEYGVVGDSITDNTDSLQALINQYPNATLFFPDGEYRANLNINQPITLASFSKNVTIRSSEDGEAVLTVNAPCRLIGLAFVHELTTSGSDGLTNEGYDIQAKECQFTGYEHNTTHNSTASTFEKCTFTITGNSLGTLAWSPNALFTSCRFDGLYGADVQDSKFYHCEFDGKWGVHMPEGSIDNSGNPSGFSGVAEFHDCILIGTENYAIGLGNKAKAIMHNCRLIGYDSGAYARSESTYEMYNCYVEVTRGGGTAAALFFSKYIKPDKAAIGLIDSGDSYFSQCTFVNSGSASGSHIIVPNKADAGNAVFSQCNFDINRVCTEDTLAFCAGDAFRYLSFEQGQHKVPQATLVLAPNTFLQPAITPANMAYYDVTGDGGHIGGIMFEKLDVQGNEYPTGFQIMIRCGSNTETVTIKNGYDAGKGVGVFTASGQDLELQLNETAIFTYTKSIWIQSSTNRAVFSDATGSVVLGGSLTLGQGVGIVEFSADANMSGNSNYAVPTEGAVRSYVDNRVQLVQDTVNNTDGQMSFSIPAGFRISSLVLEETNGQAAGNVSIGTSPGSTELVNALNVSGSSLHDCPISQSLLSMSTDTSIYISSDNWGSGLVAVYVRLESVR